MRMEFFFMSLHLFHELRFKNNINRLIITRKLKKNINQNLYYY